MKYYKVLDKNRMPCNGGIGQWAPNRWMPPVEGEIEPCRNGYHLCRREDLIFWIGPEIWEAKGRGDMVVGGDKVAFREARLVRKLKAWNERTACLFASDCAERVLHIYEKDNDNKAPANAIQAARDYANGLITADQLSASRAAAWDAAWDAARDAAWAAAMSASRDAARAASWAAAMAAARDASRDAAWAAARDAEQAWQTERLFYYLYGE